MREAEGYRPQLELLTDMFPGRAAITVNECQTALGIDRRTLLAEREFPARKIGGKYAVPLTELARWLTRKS
jgi:hypothetical protein|uniref:Helix-turn-helix domain protein n=2 Tax=root TaxID=1 RepID=A0A8S5NID1_9CAUD|nr:MAG TPA: helix-turn-helix domain protein [Siphoviridae sp. cttpk5]